MLRRLGSHIRNQWIGVLALFLVLAGGTAYAANTIGSDDVIDNSLTSADFKNNEVRTQDIRDASLNAGGIRPADVGTAPAVRATKPDGASFYDGQCYHYGVDISNNGAGDTGKAIPFSDEDYDVGGTDADGLHTTSSSCSTAATRLTAPIAGLYLITGELLWSGLDNNCSNCEYGVKQVSVRKNGSTELARNTVPTTTVAGGTDIVNRPTTQGVSTVAKLGPDDYVELYALHTDSSSLLQQVSIDESHFTLTWIGRGS
jgi:hypothetical protein